MKNISLINIKTMIFLAMLCALFNNAAIGAEPAAANLNKMILDVKPIAPEPKSEQAALDAANQLTSISNAIKENQQNILMSGTVSNPVNTSVVTRLKSIIEVIEIQRKYLVDLITSNSISNTSDNQKLDSVINSLDAQRATLSEMITTEANTTAAQQDAYGNNNARNNEFSVFSRN